MKKLSDFKDEEAIDLWIDLLKPISRIMGDPKVKEVIKEKKSRFDIATEIISLHKKETIEVLKRIDPTEVNALNIFSRTADVILEVMNSEELKGFFSNAGQAKITNGSFGSATANTEVVEN